MLADLKPGFLRFPGGCIVEGRRLALRYQWKKTVGDVAERRALINRWNNENDRVAPDYYQSFGLGFFEYFQLGEDIGASRCRSSTAAWPASSTRANWCRSTSLTSTSRTRST